MYINIITSKIELQKELPLIAGEKNINNKNQRKSYYIIVPRKRMPKND